MFKKILLGLTCVLGSLGWAFPNQAFSIQNIGSRSNNNPTHLTFDSKVNSYASNPSNTIAESTKSGLKNQLKGKWKLIDSDNSLICTNEYLENRFISSCDYEGKHIYTISYNYQILSDNFIFVTSPTYRDLIEVKINGDEMQLKGQILDDWAKFKRIK